MKEQLIWGRYFIKSKRDIALNKLHMGKMVKCSYKQPIDLEYDDAQRQIYEWIQNGDAKLVARYGSNEAYATAEARCEPTYEEAYTALCIDVAP